jgi:hypothetical protein
MHIKQFWNQAIEYYCTSNKREDNYIFISIYEGLLVKICANYLEQIGLDDKNQMERIINGNIIKSYYLTVQDAHIHLDLPELYSFLRFSIFTVFRFQENENNFNGYWLNFENFLAEKGIKKLSQNNRTEYFQRIVNKLNKICQENKLKFYNLNIYGDAAIRLNVGLIYAHALFNSEDITNIKKSIYERGFAYDISIRYLTDLQINEIISNSRIQRIINLSNKDDLSKGLIKECLQSWLEYWEPNEEEEINLTKTNKSKSRISIINLSWVWILENVHLKRNLLRQAGFIIRNSLGEKGLIALGGGSSIDLRKGYSINGQEYLYFIENFNPAVPLYSPDLNKAFVAPEENLTNQPFPLRMVSNENHEPIYFYQETRQVITFWNEKVFLATSTDITELINSRTPQFNLSPNKHIYFYRIRENFEFGRLRYIKSDNSVSILLKGVTAGVSGQKVFLSRFPITLYITNLYSGNLKVTNTQNEIFVQFEIDKKTDALHNSIELPKLKSGKYIITVIKNNIEIPIYNGRVNIDFEIVESGNRDSRQVFASKIIDEFTFTSSSYRPLRPDAKWIVLDNNCSLENQVLGHCQFDFCFSKANNWFISLNSSLYFLYLLFEIDEQSLQNKTQRNFLFEVDYIKSRTESYKYKVKVVYDAIFSAQINSSFYIYTHFQDDVRVKLWCFCFELVEIESELKSLFQDISIGSKIWIITNYRKPHQPDEIIKIISQNKFPFGMEVNHGHN